MNDGKEILNLPRTTSVKFPSTSMISVKHYSKMQVPNCMHENYQIYCMLILLGYFNQVFWKYLSKAFRHWLPFFFQLHHFFLSILCPCELSQSIFNISDCTIAMLCCTLLLASLKILQILNSTNLLPSKDKQMYYADLKNIAQHRSIRVVTIQKMEAQISTIGKPREHLMHSRTQKKKSDKNKLT